jgi:threonine dehydrogenase-like Zn-dependent dehydrogenase
LTLSACAICGSDLHLMNAVMPTMRRGDVVGHETMGEIVELGHETTNLKVGDRVVVPFTISCGEFFFCQRGFFSGCERSNPNAAQAAKLWGHSPAGLFGYSHLLGGWPPTFATFRAAKPSPSGAAAPVGQFAIRSAFLLGASRVIAIDTVPERVAWRELRRIR